MLSIKGARKQTQIYFDILNNAKVAMVILCLCIQKMKQTLQGFHTVELTNQLYYIVW